MTPNVCPLEPFRLRNCALVVQSAAQKAQTLKELRTPIYSIGMVLAFAFIANYSGLSTTLALALSSGLFLVQMTGGIARVWAFPLTALAAAE